jgi:hypothetical protein
MSERKPSGSVLPSVACFFEGLFTWAKESLVVQSYLQLHASLKDCLHEQEFASLLVDTPLDITQAHLHSCVGPRASVWLLVRPTTPSFCLSKAHFFITLCIHLGLSHLIVAHLSWCQCGHTNDDLGIHLLWCPCGNECKTIHDTFQDIIATIVLESRTHVKREVSHLFPCYTKRRMDILITSNNFHTLMDIVIVDPTRIDIVTNINDDNTCNNDGYSEEYILLRRMNTMRWLH